MGTTVVHRHGWLVSGERVVLGGKDLFSYLGQQSWMSLLLYAITARQFDAAQLKLFEGVWPFLSAFPSRDSGITALLRRA